MQRHIFCALPVFLFSGLVFVSPALAGSHSYGHQKRQQSHAMPHKHAHHSEHMRLKSDHAAVPRHASRQSNAPVAVTAPVLALPFNPIFPAPRQIIALAPEQIHYQPVYQPERRLAPEPSSVVPTDPRAVISELPSGRIFIGAPAGLHYPQHHSRKWSRDYDSRPYAPPSIQIIGDLPRKHMGGPVRLTHGTDSGKRFNAGPKVIWIKAENAGQLNANPHALHRKHLRHIK